METRRDAWRVLSVWTLLGLVVGWTTWLGGCDEEDNDWKSLAPNGHPDLALTMIIDMRGHASARELVTIGYVLTVRNLGDEDAMAVVVADTLPTAVTLQAAAADRGEYDPATGFWSLATLAPDSTAVLTLTVQVAAGTLGMVVANEACVIASEPEDRVADNDRAEVTFTVVNSVPTAGPDSYTVGEGGTLEVPAPGVLANDLDADGETFTLDTEPVETTLHGLLTLHADGSFVYVHSGGEALADSFSYVIADGVATTDTGRVTITIGGVNDPPVMEPIASQTVNEGQTFADLLLDGYVADPDDPDAALAWEAFGATNLVVTIDAAHRATVSPSNIDWYGQEMITFRVTDPGGLQAQRAVTFTVTPVNDPPVLQPIPAQTINEGQTFADLLLDSYVADPDDPDAALAWDAFGATHLVVTINAAHRATVSPPNGDWYGQETITFRVTDPGGLQAQRAVTFTVTLVNDPPVLQPIPSQTISEGQDFADLLLDNYVADPDDPDAALAWGAFGATDLVVTINAAHRAAVDPPHLDWYGQEIITFRVTDPGGLQAQRAVTFTVTPVNDPPVLQPIPAQTIDEGQTFADLLLDSYAADPDDPDAALAWEALGATNLVVTINTAHRATVSPPNGDWYGQETITFRVTDPDGLHAQRPVTFTVTPVNDPPVVANIPNQSTTVGGQFLPIPLDSYVADVDNTDAQMQWTYTGNGQFTVSINANRVATVTPPSPSWTGDVAITFRATDPGGLWDEDFAIFTVTASAAPRR